MPTAPPIERHPQVRAACHVNRNRYVIWWTSSVYDTWWWVKMVTLIIALLFTFTVRERTLRNEALGRWIGFS